jgi:hypothetical protein
MINGGGVGFGNMHREMIVMLKMLFHGFRRGTGENAVKIL